MLQRVRQRMATGEPVTIVVYGDSISEVGRTPGYFGGASCAEAHWGNRLGDLLRQAYPGQAFLIKHFGVGGQNSYEGLGRLDWLTPYAPDLVLLAFGTNDCGWHPLCPTDTREAYWYLIGGVQERFGADVVVVGPGCDNPQDPVMRHVEETVAIIQSMAEEKGVPFVNIRQTMLAETHNGERWEQYHHSRQDCHPTDPGHQVWAQTVFSVLQRELP